MTDDAAVLAVREPGGSGDAPVPIDGVDLLVEGVRALGADRSPADVQALVTASAVACLPGASHAAITVDNGRGRLVTVAATGDLPVAVDELQYTLGGPSVDAAGPGRDHAAALHVQDLRTDDRWPEFARAAVDRTPVRSMLSFRLVIGHSDDEMLGALSVYATSPDAFPPASVVAGQRLAACAAVVLAYAVERRKAGQLQEALARNRDIGAAVGIIMCRRIVTRDQAFDLLRIASQHANRKVHELALEVIYTGDLAPGRRP